MQSSFSNSFEKVSKKNRGQKRQFNQGNPHRFNRKMKRSKRYSED